MTKSEMRAMIEKSMTSFCSAKITHLKYNKSAETKLKKRYGHNLTAKIQKVVDSKGRKRAGSIGNCNEALQMPNNNGVGFQNIHPEWLKVS